MADLPVITPRWSGSKGLFAIDQAAIAALAEHGPDAVVERATPFVPAFYLLRAPRLQAAVADLEPKERAFLDARVAALFEVAPTGRARIRYFADTAAADEAWRKAGGA